MAFFCSRSCPGDVILKAQDWANARAADDAPVISGFHTPVERDVLRILLRGDRPIIYTVARAREGARLSASLRAAETQGHAVILSPFSTATRRTTARTAEERNRHILTRTATVLIAHASPGGKTEALAAEAIAMGLPLFTLSSPSNTNLVSMGAVVI
ncbi:hypothetical protein [Sandarakinorhabdus limnophila]|uniref:hypothetical protein n=1 Tax=Sandarakinorhabdus limnophila TaxID=210512 RepID=UPI0026EF19DF|nr:hypothetical protein [Sandarakinorhabdus limnophila]MCM0032074.1 hypothetical protein [Sandarakinorhabdus limnophila]